VCDSGMNTVFIYCRKITDMGQIRDIMEKNVITIEDDKSSLDAARLINEKDISFLVVVKDGSPIGVVSERDFVRKIVAENTQASDIPLSKIMSYKFRWVEPTTEIEDAVQKMLNHNIRRLLVLENKKLVGVITQTDLASYLRSKLLIEGTVKNLGKDD
jgi:CBS domain-containing protein